MVKKAELEERFIEEFGCSPQDYRNRHGEPLYLKAVAVCESLIEREKERALAEEQHVEESKALRGDLRERIEVLLEASERQSRDFDLLLRTKIDLHNLIVSYFEETKKVTDKITVEWKNNVEALGKAITEFTDLSKEARKEREKAIEAIQLYNKKTEILNRAILAYNDKAIALDARYKKLLAKLHSEIDRVNKLRGAYEP